MQHSATDPGGAPPNTLFVPEVARLDVLQWGHSPRLACHPGLTRTLHFLHQWSWWPSMARNAIAFTAICPACA